MSSCASKLLPAKSSPKRRREAAFGFPKPLPGVCPRVFDYIDARRNERLQKGCPNFTGEEASGNDLSRRQ